MEQRKNYYDDVLPGLYEQAGRAANGCVAQCEKCGIMMKIKQINHEQGQKSFLLVCCKCGNKKMTVERV